MPERSTGAMMLIGERCALSSCHREDFLPFRCDCCRESFCSAHFRPLAHRCAEYDEAADGYRVPLCPLCDSPPEGWQRNQDPNIAMDRHLSSGLCSALDADGLIRTKAKARVKKQNECAAKKCTKIMVIPIQCPQCRASFCPSHRAPAQHSCGSSPAASSTRLPRTNAKSTPALSKPTAPADKKPTSQEPKPSAGDKLTNSKLFSKTPKRAKQERLSAIKAMQARQKKGLLTSAEETKLAEEMASMARISNGKKESDCVIC